LSCIFLSVQYCGPKRFAGVSETAESECRKKNVDKMQNFVIWDATPKKKDKKKPSALLPASTVVRLAIVCSFHPRPIHARADAYIIVRLITVRHAGPRRIIGLDTAGWSRRGVMLGCRGHTAKYLRMKDRFNKVFYFFRFIFFHNFIGQSRYVYAHIANIQRTAGTITAS